MKSYDDRVTKCEKNLKTRILIDLNHSVTCSIKALAVPKTADIKPTSRFFKNADVRKSFFNELYLRHD